MIYPHTPTVAPEKAACPSALALCTYSTTGGERASMKMYEIEVKPLEGLVYLTQEEFGSAPNCIAIAPEQAELVCKWIMSAAESLQGEA